MSIHAADLILAERAALAAGAWLRHLPVGQRRADSAVGKDIKLGADRAAESVILQTLAGQSDYPVLAEESGVTGSIDERPYWVVDPLDGSMNYSRGLGLECVSIALWQRDEPLLGVVYDFGRDELFSGLVGSGASCNGVPCSVSSVTDRGQAILVTGFPVGRDYATDSLAGFVSQVRAFKKIRMIGSAALSLAWVACGRVDAYWEEGIKLWDVGAGLALVRAAGGWVACTPDKETGFSRNVRTAANAVLFGNDKP